MRVIAGCCLALSIVTSAVAADYEPPMMRDNALQVGAPAVPQWAGFYFGGQGAFATSSTDFSQATQSLVAFMLRNTTIESENGVSRWQTLGQASTSAFGYGGFVGYNWQWADAVLGADLSYVHASLNTNSAASIARMFSTSDGFVNNVSVTASASLAVKDYGSVRARAGYAFGDILPYATVGLALGRGNFIRSATVTASGTNSSTTPPLTYGPSTGTQTASDIDRIMYGWALGAGFDYQLMSNLFVRAEWEYLRFTVPVDTYISSAKAGVGIRF